MPVLVLPGVNPLTAEAETAQIDIEPVGQIIAFATHESNLLVGDGELFQIAHLLHDKVGKPFGIDGIVTVVKFILHPCAGIVVDDSAAHRELVQVVVGKMVDNLPHHITIMYKTCKGHWAVKRQAASMIT